MTRDHRAVARELDGLLGRSTIARGPRTPSPPPPLPTPTPAASAAPRRRWAPVLAAGLLAGVGLNGAVWLTTDRPEPKTIGGKRATAPAETPAPRETADTAAATPRAPAVLPDIAPDAAVAETQAQAPVEVARAATPPVREAAAAPVPARRETAVRCDRLSPADEVDCLYDVLLAADRRLAAAYEQAVDAGVPTRALRELRRDWSYARRFAEDDPVGVARTYDAIAGDLRQASRDAL